MPMSALVEELTNSIDKTYSEQKATHETVLLIAARDKIEALEMQLACCGHEVERLFRWINETRNEPIEIVRKPRRLA